MTRRFQALTVMLIVILTLFFPATATISVDELKAVAKENADTRPNNFNSKGPLARKLTSKTTTQISFASDPNYEMKMEVKNRIKGLKVDSLASSATGETDDMEKVARRNLRH